MSGQRFELLLELLKRPERRMGWWPGEGDAVSFEQPDV